MHADLGLDMPSRQVICQYPDKSFVRVLQTFGAVKDERCELVRKRMMLFLPKDEIRVRHEIGYPLQHTTGLKDKCWKGDL